MSNQSNCIFGGGHMVGSVQLGGGGGITRTPFEVNHLDKFELVTKDVKENAKPYLKPP